MMASACVCNGWNRAVGLAGEGRWKWHHFQIGRAEVTFTWKQPGGSSEVAVLAECKSLRNCKKNEGRRGRGEVLAVERNP